MNLLHMYRVCLHNHRGRLLPDHAAFPAAAAIAACLSDSKTQRKRSTHRAHHRSVCTKDELLCAGSDHARSQSNYSNCHNTSNDESCKQSEPSRYQRQPCVYKRHSCTEQRCCSLLLSEQRQAQGTSVPSTRHFSMEQSCRELQSMSQYCLHSSQQTHKQKTMSLLRNECSIPSAVATPHTDLRVRSTQRASKAAPARAGCCEWGSC
jgi:hypothetical protein